MEIIREVLKNPEMSLLCAGPISRNVTEVAIQVADKFRAPIVLIASRRQIECSEFGGGYVNNWTTESFSEFVLKKKSPYIFMARDHGGPWQGSYEIRHQLSLEKSMAVAKKSFEVDIDSGFSFIHIDPTVPILNEDLDNTTIMDRLFELYGHVCDYAEKRGRVIEIELGTEEQSGGSPDKESFQLFLRSAKDFAKINKLRPPLFVVAQTGTKVFETRNVGVFESSLATVRADLMRSIKQSADIALEYGCFIKEHNTDYLSLQNLIVRPSIGIKAVNIAPELGVIETKALIYLLQTYGNQSELEEFISVVVQSQKWQKWTSSDSTLSLVDQVFIAGHYCYMHPSVIKIKNSLSSKLKRKGIDLDDFLQKNIRTVLTRYLTGLGQI